MTYITFKQNGKWTTFPSQSMVGIIGQPVTIAAVDFPGGSTYGYADLPNYSAINPMMFTSAGSSSFTPDVPGTYQFVIYGEGFVELERRDFIVPLPNGFIVPAFRSNANTFMPDKSGLGYKTAVNDILAAVTTQIVGDVVGALSQSVVESLTGNANIVSMLANNLSWNNGRTPLITQDL